MLDKMGAQWCDDCEGSGRLMVHRPDFYDPYYMHQTNAKCPTCLGTGVVPIDTQPDGEL
jgi:DnaJ-class molecular chaperone